MGSTIGLYFSMTQPEANAMRRQLNEIAASHGFTSHRGPTAGQGNASDLLLSIASGEMATVLLADEERASVIAWLDAQAKSLDYPLSESIKSLATQLYAAVKRERDAEEQEMREDDDE